MPDRDLIAEGPVVPTYDERIAEGNRALEQVVRLTSLLDRTEEQLTDARARIAELQGERVADEFGLQSVTAENGVATLTTVPTTEQARKLVLTMSLACGRMLDDDQAQNYIEFEASPANHPGYIVHVRRAGGPSPHTLRREAEARAAKAEARIVDLEDERDDLGETVGRVTDLYEAWAAEENEHRAAGEFGLAEGLHVAIKALREAVHGAAFARSFRQRHTWECANRTRIGVPELDACDCPEVNRG